MSTKSNMHLYFLRILVLIASSLYTMNAVASFAFTRSSTATRRYISRTGARLASTEGATKRFPKLFSSSISDNDATSTETINESPPKQKKKSTRKSRNRARRAEQELLGESQTELNWESFDFSLNPKQDHRFRFVCKAWFFIPGYVLFRCWSHHVAVLSIKNYYPNFLSCVNRSTSG